MAKQMRGLSDTQMKVMVRVAGFAQAWRKRAAQGARALKRTREFAASRAALVIALAVLVLAALLRYFGIA